MKKFILFLMCYKIIFGVVVLKLGFGRYGSNILGIYLLINIPIVWLYIAVYYISDTFIKSTYLIVILFLIAILLDLYLQLFLLTITYITV